MDGKQYEKQLLKEFQISDWSEIDEEKAKKIASKLSSSDSENVGLIANIPHFLQFATRVLDHIIVSGDEVTREQNAQTKELMNQLISLKEQVLSELKNEPITQEQKNYLSGLIVDILRISVEVDKNHKIFVNKMHTKTIGILGLFGNGVAGLTIWGISIFTKKKGE